jgi:hypothetical protein
MPDEGVITSPEIPQPVGFVIRLPDITAEQLYKIIYNDYIDQKLPGSPRNWAWKIKIGEEHVIGTAGTGEYKMDLFLDKIGVLPSAIVWKK